MRTRSTTALLFFTFQAFLLLFRCSSETDTSIDYLGQSPPSPQAEIFAPGLISTDANEHSAVAFSPDGAVVLWSVMDSRYRGHMFEMRYVNGTWSTPNTPSFVDTTADHYCPSFSSDGKILFFSSNRKAPEGYPEGRGNRIWSVEKTKDGWGLPVAFDTTVSKSREFGHSIAKNGTLYFASQGTDRNVEIMKAKKTNDRYEKPILLPEGINGEGYEDGPYISPDDDFLIFESTRPEGIEGSHDLYIAFKTESGAWEMPKNMGPKINSPGMERFPRLSPDGKYFFFGSNRGQTTDKPGFDIYWIEAGVIEELRGK